MSIDEQYLRAELALPKRLGPVALLPFQLGHALLLERLRHPLVTGKVQPGRGDLLLAVWICSRPSPLALTGINRRRIRWQLGWLRLLLWRISTVELRERLAALIASGHQGPHYEPARKTEGNPGAPALLSYKCNQMVIWGRTEDEAFCRPLAAAKWDLFIHLEQEGGLEIRERAPETVQQRLARLFPGRRVITAAEFRKYRTQGGGSVLAKSPPEHN